MTEGVQIILSKENSTKSGQSSFNVTTELVTKYPSHFKSYSGLIKNLRFKIIIYL